MGKFIFFGLSNKKRHKNVFCLPSISQQHWVILAFVLKCGCMKTSSQDRLLKISKKYSYSSFLIFFILRQMYHAVPSSHLTFDLENQETTDRQTF